MVERFNGWLSQVPCSHHLPQKALGHETPVQALKKWKMKIPKLFIRNVRNHPDLTAKPIQELVSLETAQQAVRGMSPMGDIVTVENVTASVAFLASQDARMITGADLVIDGSRLIQ